MPEIARRFDSCGDFILGTEPTVHVSDVSGLSTIATVPSTIVPHGPGSHSIATITVGSSTVFAGGKAVIRTGDAATCGHTAISGQSTVFAG